MKVKEFAPVTLKNGLVIQFIDQSNRYFGDFHRVFIQVTISLPEQLAASAGLSTDRASLVRSLEKMAVPGKLIDAERESLIDAFLETSTAYLEKDNFPQQLLVKLRQEKSKPVFMRKL